MIMQAVVMHTITAAVIMITMAMMLDTTITATATSTVSYHSTGIIQIFEATL
jgi:hypothetical protein